MSVSYVAYATLGMMKMASGSGTLRSWRRAAGQRPYDQWSLERACQSGPGVATYPVLLPPYLGEHVEQSVRFATSPVARLLPLVDVGCYGVPKSVPSDTGSGTTDARPPTCSATPPRSPGVSGFYRAVSQLRPQIFGAAAGKRSRFDEMIRGCGTNRLDHALGGEGTG